MSGIAGVIRLKPGREKSLLRRHPWIFSGAIDRVSPDLKPGCDCRIEDFAGHYVATAAYSPASQLTARVWSFDPGEAIDRDFFRSRINTAAMLRSRFGLDDPEGGCRLIFSESDGLPGVIADRYTDYIALQILSAGAEFHLDEIAEVLQSVTGAKGIYERSDVSIRSREKLDRRRGILCGEEPPEEIVICENGCRFAVDLRHGQKTGFYFDLREVRRAVAPAAVNSKMLNAFCYTGAFAVNAMKAGAGSVLNLDSSRPALNQALRNLELNGIDSGVENRECDVFEMLRELADADEKFDFIILDPPKLVENQGQLAKGCRAYQYLARLGLQLLNPGGILFNMSCSGLMTPELFQKIAASAALEAGVDASIVGKFHQAADHPVNLAVPETAYLKGLEILRLR